MVDQYIKNDFQDIIGGGLKTKFKVINVIYVVFKS